MGAASLDLSAVTTSDYQHLLSSVINTLYLINMQRGVKKIFNMGLCVVFTLHFGFYMIKKHTLNKLIK